MTRQEAIKWLEMQSSKPVKWDDYSEDSREIREEAERRMAKAINMAINALQAQKTSIEKVAEDYGLTVDGVSFALKQYSKVIFGITNGMLSKLGYRAEDILSLANDVQCEGCELKERSEVNPNCHGLGYDECETCESICPYR